MDGEEAKPIFLRAFARREMPKGVDSEAVVRLALGYLDDAAAEEAEGEAANEAHLASPPAVALLSRTARSSSRTG